MLNAQARNAVLKVPRRELWLAIGEYTFCNSVHIGIIYLNESTINSELFLFSGTASESLVDLSFMTSTCSAPSVDLGNGSRISMTMYARV